MELWDAYKEELFKFVESDKHIQNHKERISEYLDAIR